ncbi:MAG: hypothetical protein M5R40_26385 [Anaerolineae bacterium]|nr:hypothetical protein [Anaerolineae bacterium]
MAAEDYRDTVRRLALDAASFIQLTLKGRARGGDKPPWRMVTVRPVTVRHERRLQFSYYDARQHVAKNYRSDEAGGAARRPPRHAVQQHPGRDDRRDAARADHQDGQSHPAPRRPAGGRGPPRPGARPPQGAAAP